jgi:hypothetical protein
LWDAYRRHQQRQKIAIQVRLRHLVVDCEFRPYFSPSAVIEDMCALLKCYNVTEVSGNHYDVALRHGVVHKAQVPGDAAASRGKSPVQASMISR